MTTNSAHYKLRSATESDISLLQAIERSASLLFIDSPYPELSRGNVVSAEVYRRHMEQDHMILIAFACHQDGYVEPTGFVFTAPLGDGLHLHELSVHYDHQRCGIGSLLLDAVLVHARAQQYRHVSLTTYRSIAWNGPFYRKHGFCEAAHADMTSDLQAILSREISKGANAQDRCVMLCGLETEAIRL